MNKIEGVLGMAMRARILSTGDKVIDDIRGKKAKLVIIAKDASDNTIKKITDKCKFYEVEYCFIESSDVLNHAIGKENVKAVALKEEGFVKKIKTCLKG